MPRQNNKEYAFLPYCAYLQNRANSNENFVSYFRIFTKEKQAKISPTFPVNLNLLATRSDPLSPKGSK